MLAILTLMLPLMLSGCLFGSESKTEYHGKYVSAEDLQKVSGFSKDEVLELFGEPTAITEVDLDTELWSWSYSKVTRSSGFIFLIYSTSNKHSEDGAVYVRFRDGVVEKAWRTVS